LSIYATAALILTLSTKHLLTLYLCVHCISLTTTTCSVDDSFSCSGSTDPTAAAAASAATAHVPRVLLSRKDLASAVHDRPELKGSTAAVLARRRAAGRKQLAMRKRKAAAAGEPDDF
jgi:hypothetical protein